MISQPQDAGMMTDPALPLPPLTEPPGRRVGAVIGTVIAWNVIVGVCLALPLLRASHKAAAVPTTQSATRPAREPVDFQTKLYGRYVVGTAKMLPGQTDAAESMLAVPSPTPQGRIAAAIVAGEVIGPDAAVTRLRAIDDPDAAAFVPAYAPAGGATTRPDLSGLEPRFDWFARLAESYGRPDADPVRAAVLGQAQRTVLTVVAAFSVIAAAAVVGWALFNTAIVLGVLGRFRFRLGPPVGPAHVYAESAAIYLGGFVVASVVIGLLVREPSFVTQVVGLGGVVVLAVIWPFVRGVRWAELRQDWGVHTGRNVFVEMAAGVVGYVAGLPVLFAGVGVTVLLLHLTQGDASHPITQEINAGPVWVLYVIAAVFAPLTEELMFRGALVAHLRAGTGVVAAAALSGLVFAAVHPQGWAAIPALGSIGAVLALVRQWRGSLIASVTAHALNNAFVVTLLTLATR